MVETSTIAVIYPKSMIYLPVQIYALCQDFSGDILSFNVKCLIMPRATLTSN